MAKGGEVNNITPIHRLYGYVPLLSVWFSDHPVKKKGLYNKSQKSLSKTGNEILQYLQICLVKGTIILCG